jgi:hypothetical protein
VRCSLADDLFDLRPVLLALRPCQGNSVGSLRRSRWLGCYRPVSKACRGCLMFRRVHVLCVRWCRICRIRRKYQWCCDSRCGVKNTNRIATNTRRHHRQAPSPPHYTGHSQRAETSKYCMAVITDGGHGKTVSVSEVNIMSIRCTRPMHCAWACVVGYVVRRDQMGVAPGQIYAPFVGEPPPFTRTHMNFLKS